MDGVLLLWREHLNVAAIGPHDSNAVAAAADQDKRDSASVGRPRWVFMIRIVVRELYAFQTIRVHSEQLFLARNHRNEDEPFAVRRWRWIEVLSVGNLHRNRQWTFRAVHRPNENQCCDERRQQDH